MYGPSAHIDSCRYTVSAQQAIRPEPFCRRSKLKHTPSADGAQSDRVNSIRQQHQSTTAIERKARDRSWPISAMNEVELTCGGIESCIFTHLATPSAVVYILKVQISLFSTACGKPPWRGWVSTRNANRIMHVGPRSRDARFVQHAHDTIVTSARPDGSTNAAADADDKLAGVSHRAIGDRSHGRNVAREHRRLR